MMRTIITYLVLLICSLNCFAQVFTAPVYGKVLDRNLEPVNNIEVLMLENNTTLDSTFTDSTGNYQFKTQFYDNKEYSILVKCYNRNDFPEVIRTKNDTSRVESYHFEMICNISSKKTGDDKNMYFKYNSIKKSENIKVEYYRSLLEKYPKLCLEFRQTINPKEELETAESRLDYFKSQLEKVGCDMSRINISYEIKYLNNFELSIDKRSRIEEYVLSNDGKCN